MRKILILGAGRSASSLTRYLIDKAPTENWGITVADRDLEGANTLVAGADKAATAVALDAADDRSRQQAIGAHDLTISMLPATMHMEVLKDCMALGKHVITPSYVSEAQWAMDRDLREAGIVAMSELGLDPGIDHMSAMRILDGIKTEGGSIHSFESYTGGLVAPGSDDNPWGYKFSWNPRNVVLAGQGGAARFIQEGILRYIPYHRLFMRHVPMEVPGYGRFDGYPNRDSLKYRSLYGLDNIPTLVRGTLRREGFCAAWNVFVQLGCTDDSYSMELPRGMTWMEFFNTFLPPDPSNDMRANLAAYLDLPLEGDVMNKLEWLGVFASAPCGMHSGSPAAILQHLLEGMLVLRPEDRDMIVMQHVIGHELGGRILRTTSSLVVEGEDRRHTAMARTVGLPVAIAAKMVLNGNIRDRGVVLPLKPEIYLPILGELEEYGVRFEEEVVNIEG